MHPEALTEKGKNLFPLLAYFPEFTLAGGTALALQLGHRVSVDFDLFSGEEIPANLLAKIKRVFANFTVAVIVNNQEELTALIDPVDPVKITFLHYPFPQLWPDVVYERVKTLSAKELSLTKAYTIGRRGEYKDYIDLFYCLRAGIIDLEEMLEVLPKKYGQEINLRLFLEQLVYLDDLIDTKIDFLKPTPSKEMLAQFFQSEVEKIKLV